MPTEGKLIKKGKILSFMLFTFGGGLLQLWTLYFMLLFNGNSPTISELLGDGGLYFFSTSLAFSSFISLSNHASMQLGDINFNFSAITLGTLVFISVVAYVSVLTKNIGVASPFSCHLLSQVACVLISSVYSFYVCTVTGFFMETR